MPTPPDPDRRVRSGAAATGVTFLVPVRNGAEWLEPVLGAILAQADGRPFEALVVEDGSTDESSAILAHLAASGAIRVIDGSRRGAAAALNVALRAARHPIICQVDQDVILDPGWMQRLTAALEDPAVGAAQGYYRTPPDGTIWARVMGLDLEWRYHQLRGSRVDHVCTGNTAYRAAALRAVGLFDEALGYGYDNDLSYRLTAAGYGLVICPDARSLHRWRDGWRTYLRQQYGFGYGRLDLVAKHRHRARGDDVSRLTMVLHAPLMAAAVVLALLAGVLWLLGTGAAVPAWMAGAVLATLATERLTAGVCAAVRFRNAAGLWFVPVHLARDLAWAAAIGMWTFRRLRGLRPRPSHSMHPRAAMRRGPLNG